MGNSTFNIEKRSLIQSLLDLLLVLAWRFTPKFRTQKIASGQEEPRTDVQELCVKHAKIDVVLDSEKEKIAGSRGVLVLY